MSDCESENEGSKPSGRPKMREYPQGGGLGFPFATMLFIPRQLRVGSSVKIRNGHGIVDGTVMNLPLSSFCTVVDDAGRYYRISLLGESEKPRETSRYTGPATCPIVYDPLDICDT